MNKDTKIKKYINIFKLITIFTIIEFIMLNSDWVCRDIILHFSCLIVFILYFIKEFMRIKWNLMKEEPKRVYLVDILSDLFLLSSICLFIIINKLGEIDYLVKIAVYMYFVLYIIRAMQYIKYSKDGDLFLGYLFLVFILGVIDEKSQIILSFMTTIITTLYGKFILEIFFYDQIKKSEANEKLNREVILGTLEYRLAMINIAIILTQIIVVMTAGLKNLDFYKALPSFQKFAMIAFIRFIILSGVQFLLLSKYGKKLKDVLFKTLLRTEC